jgi:hypothetical protein
MKVRSAILFVVSFCYLVPSFAKQGQTAMRYLHLSKFLLPMKLNRPRFGDSKEFVTRMGLSVAILFLLHGCSSGTAPLSIKLYNPQTNQTLTCAATDPMARTDNSVLASAAEGCAKQLEARGFVREK